MDKKRFGKITAAILLVATALLIAGCGKEEKLTPAETEKETEAVKEQVPELEGLWKACGITLLERTEDQFETDLYFDYEEAQENFLPIKEYEKWIQSEHGTKSLGESEDDYLAVTLQYPGDDYSPAEYSAVYSVEDAEANLNFKAKEGKYEGCLFSLPIMIKRDYTSGIEKVALVCEDGRLYMPFYHPMKGEKYTEYEVFEKVD